MGTYYIGNVPCSGNDIYHYGRKGMKWGKNIFGKISEFFTGNNARRELSSAKTALRGAQQKSRHFDGQDINGRYAFDIRKDYNNPINIAGETVYPFEPTGKRWSPEIDKQKDRLSKAQGRYNRTLPGMAEKARQQAQEAMAKAREQVSKAYADAAEKAGGAGKNIQAFYSDVMAKAKNTINQGKNLVSKYGDQYASQIEEMGKNALNGGKQFLEGIMNRAKDASKTARDKVTGEISKFKARDAEKRDREREIGKKNTHDRNVNRNKRYHEIGAVGSNAPNSIIRSGVGAYRDDLGNVVYDDRFKNNSNNRFERRMRDDKFLLAKARSRSKK